MATPRKPQDRKAPAPTNAERELEFSEVEGHELLKPFSQIKSSDQARLMQRLRGAIGDDAEDTDIDLDAFADFIDYLEENYVVDAAGWQEFSTGSGALHRTMELVMAYAGEMGKGVA